MRIRILLLVLFACLLGRVDAQDPHFTQAHRLPTWYNPATVGASPEALRIAAVYRNQWASVTSPFRTEAFFAEKRVEQHGLGFSLVNNHAGPTGFRQLYAGGQWSLSRQFGKNLFSAGLHLGILQRSFDPSQMTFDEQYSPDQGSTPALPNSENFVATSRLRPDAGLGLFWRQAGEESARFTPFAGLGATHLNKPRETYILEEGSVEPRYTAQVGTGYRISETVMLASLIQFSKQSISNELMASIRGQIRINESNDIEGMLLIRKADALAFGVSYRWARYSIGMSYDVNISGISGAPGAAEIMLVYIPEVRIKAKRFKKSAEVVIEKPVELVAAVNVHDSTSSALQDPVNSNPAQVRVQTEEVKSDRKGEDPVAGAVHTGSTTPLSEAIAVILPSIGSRSDSSLRSTSLIDENTPNLADILAAFADGSDSSTRYASEQVQPVSQDEPVVAPIAALPIQPLTTELPPIPLTVKRNEKTSTTTLPIESDPELTPEAVEVVTKVEPQVPVLENTPVKEMDLVEFEQWIGFEEGSSRVHGLYKLDVIEPALDLLLNDYSLSLELSMPLPEGHPVRKGVVKEIFVTKGLEPARIRLLSESQDGSVTTSPAQAGAVRVRILRAR